MINVTKTYLPNIEKYKKYIDKIYNSGWVTNNGPLVRELEAKLMEYLNVSNLLLVSNGTIALEIAYRALNISNYVITTPFSFVATTSSLVTNGINPIYSDINKDTLNLDPFGISKKITPNTSAIVPVHVFGNPCDIEQINELANNWGLKVIFDAAHAFGVKKQNKSILSYGDISTLSFHATKLFHTIEGGAIVFKDKAIYDKAKYLINFGIKNANSIPELGTNGKMNEFEAAMGLCMLDDIDLIIENRGYAFDYYEKNLRDYVKLQKRTPSFNNNYSYFPVIFEHSEQLLAVLEKLSSMNIFPRRYFYPSLDTLSYIEPKQECQNSRDVASKILCLPLFHGIEKKVQTQIINTIKDVVK